jgi:hypothetical protein
VGGTSVGAAGASVGATGASVGAAVGVAQAERTMETMIKTPKTANNFLDIGFSS